MSSFSTLRSALLKGGMLLFLCLLLLFPGAAVTGAKNGLFLWFEQVLPSLLPFLILSSLFLSTGLSNLLAKALSPVLSPLLRCSPFGCYAAVLGMLSGLPVGAKTVAELVRSGKITKKEGSFLLPLCNTMSPLFILGYISVSVLALPKLRYLLLFIILFSGILASMLLRKKSYEPLPDAPSGAVAFRFSFLLLDNAIEQAFHVITKVGGYMILFSVLAKFLSLLPLSHFYLAVFTGILEVTTGSAALATLPLPNTVLLPLLAAFVTFGGLSTAAQTKSVLTGTGLPFAHYLLTKALAACIAALLTLFFLVVVHVI